MAEPEYTDLVGQYLVQSGKKGVQIVKNRYERHEDSWDVSVMRNGYQWSGFTGDVELLTMLRDALTKVLEER